MELGKKWCGNSLDDFELAAVSHSHWLVVRIKQNQIYHHWATWREDKIVITQKRSLMGTIMHSYYFLLIFQNFIFPYAAQRRHTFISSSSQHLCEIGWAERQGQVQGHSVISLTKWRFELGFPPNLRWSPGKSPTVLWTKAMNMSMPSFPWVSFIIRYLQNLDWGYRQLTKMHCCYDYCLLISNGRGAICQEYHAKRESSSSYFPSLCSVLVMV